MANLFAVSPRTIRYYEEIGLLLSEERVNQNQQRWYTNDERRRLKLILRGKRLGFSLQEIKEMIRLYESNPSGQAERQKIFEYIDVKLQQLDKKIAELQLLKTDILAHKERFMNERTTDTLASDTIKPTRAR